MNAAKRHFKKQTNADILHHQQRIDDIDNGKLDHFDKSYRVHLREQSERILKNPFTGYNSAGN